MNLDKEFIPYEQALALKELGFDEPCFAVYSEHDKTRVYDESAIREGLKIQTPLYQQAFRWFREKYGYYISVFRTHDSNWGTDLWLLGVHKPKATVFGETYEEVEQACLIKLIEIVKQ